DAGGAGPLGGEDFDVNGEGVGGVGGEGGEVAGGVMVVLVVEGEGGEQAVADGDASLQNGARGAPCIDVRGVGIGGVAHVGACLSHDVSRDVVGVAGADRREAAAAVEQADVVAEEL